MNKLDSTSIGARVAKVLQAFPEVQAAYLFGSVAQGRARKDSDIDLALVPRSPGLEDRRLDILAAFAAAGLDNVDLVILRNHDLVLRYEAIRPNVLVYARPDFVHGDYYSRTIREYLDFLPILEEQRKAYKKRLLNDKTRGLA